MGDELLPENMPDRKPAGARMSRILPHIWIVLITAITASIIPAVFYNGLEALSCALDPLARHAALAVLFDMDRAQYFMIWSLPIAVIFAVLVHFRLRRNDGFFKFFFVTGLFGLLLILIEGAVWPVYNGEMVVMLERMTFSQICGIVVAMAVAFHLTHRKRTGISVPR